MRALVDATKCTRAGGAGSRITHRATRIMASRRSRRILSSDFPDLPCNLQSDTVGGEFVADAKRVKRPPCMNLAHTDCCTKKHLMSLSALPSLSAATSSSLAFVQCAPQTPHKDRQVRSSLETPQFQCRLWHSHHLRHFLVLQPSW